MITMTPERRAFLALEAKMRTLLRQELCRAPTVKELDARIREERQAPHKLRLAVAGL